MRILGLDPASVKMGYGVVDAVGARITYVEGGVLTAPEGWNKYKRLAALGRDLAEVLEEFKPDVAAIEAGFVHGQMGALTSGAARGVAGYLCAARGLTVVEYAPATVKKAVTGSGATEKAGVQRMVQLLFGLRVLPQEDAADALAVAVAHARAPGAAVVLRLKGAA